MASVSYQISNLLEKMMSNDKDFRFMATNDLMTELQKDSIKLDDDSERKVVKMLLRLLEDKNGEVQNLAVKCLGPLVNKVKEYQVETIVDALCTNMVSEKEQLRDISSIGLKTVISELPLASSQLAGNVCKRITGRLSAAIAKQEDVSVQLEALDILADLLSRFGTLIVSFHATILDNLLPQLASPRQAVRKRTIVALGLLVMSCHPSLYTKLMLVMQEELDKNSSISTTRTYIQCVAAICRQAGHRFGEYVEQMVPLIAKYSREDDDELREFCMQAFEAFVQRCPKEISPHIPLIVNLCLEYITYDPNYNYEEEPLDDDNAMETEDEDGGDEDGDEEYSDDDDMSWKVRRAAAKCLEAVISTKRELLPELYGTVSPALISRFKEREENVKSDIFHAYMALLRQTRRIQSVAVEPDSMDAEDGPVIMLQNQVPTIVKAVHKQMREKSIKTRQDCLTLLREMVIVLPGCLASHIPALVPGILYSLGDKNSSSNMKIDTLSFISSLVSSHEPTVFHPHIPALLPPVIAAVRDGFYKITAEALLVLQQLVQVIRPVDRPCNFDFKPFTTDLYECTLHRLRAADIDQEVKERAISCMGQIICNLGDYLQDELPKCLPIFLERLRNEITRLTTVKALTKVAGSPLHINLEPVLLGAMQILGSFLRKNQRALKLATLTLLDVLVRSYHKVMDQSQLTTVIVELPALLSETDLHIAQLTLTLLTSVAQTLPMAVGNIGGEILPEILVLVKSPLLQGAALVSMLDFFQALVQANLPGLSFAELVKLLRQPVVVEHSAASLHKQALHSLAKCVAAIALIVPGEALNVPSQLAASKLGSTNQERIFNMYTIGEIGRHKDLSGIAQVSEVLLASFSSAAEEVKSVAAYSLGSVASGNLNHYLGTIMSEMKAKPKKEYLLLHSLKEMISYQASTAAGRQALQPHVPAIWQYLYEYRECAEEGTRNVVAECLGKLTLIDPDTLMPHLRDSLNSESAHMRTIAVTAIKFTISDQPQAIDPLLRQHIGQFLAALKDRDPNVRRVALVAFNSAAHNKPSLVRDLLDEILPQLYEETKVKRELIREVEMGPFKHTVDDGLDIRKAAFECMYTLLDSCMDRLDVFAFLDHVQNGLRDHYDIKMLTYLMVSRLSQLFPSAVLQRLVLLVEPLKKTCTTKVKANSVKQEFEKQDELKRSAMRAVSALLAIPSADKNPAMAEFVTIIKSTPELQIIFESIQKDSSLAAGGQDSPTMMDLS
ncbi:cullin-associated NEDD8-dissociated protein 1 isoform X2 [Cloeon dipterum]|uniref:cullin-associated NEDD8-dissociated protein 1 isoform X2 n=1 Tax=Cloeon dipterum TaxID=197152 RepID=UPI00322084E6